MYGGIIMTYYLGIIQLGGYSGTYYNFKPQYLYDPDSKTIEEISRSELELKFPQYGEINLSYEMYRESAPKKFLNALEIANKESYDCLYSVCFSEEDLEKNENEKIQIKLDLQSLVEKGKNLCDIIKPIEDIGIYKIVNSKTDIVNYDAFNNLVLVNEKYFIGQHVLLAYEGSLYGPYELHERPIYGDKYISPSISSNGYVLKKYSEKYYKKFDFSQQSHDRVSVAIITGEPELVDALPDAILLDKLQDKIDIELLKNNVYEFDRLVKTSPFLGDIPESFQKKRIGRIKEIITNALNYEDEKKKAIISLIDESDSDVQILLGEKIKESNVYKESQETIDRLKNEVEHLSSDKDELEKNNKVLEEKIIELENEDNSTEAITKSEELISIKDENEKLKNDNQELKDKVSLYDDVMNLENKKNELTAKNKDLQATYDDWVLRISKKRTEYDTLQKEVKETVSSEMNTTKMVKTAFDPYISNLLVEAAGQWSKSKEYEKYKEISEYMRNLPCENIRKTDLIDNLVEDIQQFRNYSRNDIINMYICLSQNFLTIFSGEPGTGKTSICSILAYSLGLNSFGFDSNISRNRFIPVSVERGWSSKRDLIGYFNPLTKRYDRSNAKIYDGLMILNEERENSRFPFVILLDEANLSPIEYYWADFMRIADKSDKNMFINIGLDDDIYIPETLHFLATINNDQTTEQLSPRLVDRAWIVKLPKSDVKETEKDITDYFSNIYLWSDIKKAFVDSGNGDMQLQALAEKIYKLFDDHYLTVSPRIKQSIKKYVCIAQEIMEDELGVSKKEKALDFAILQKLLPKINGMYENYRRLFESLSQICEENHLKMTKQALSRMQESADQNMGYCRYLV